MRQYPTPVRCNVTQQIGPYIFKDQFDKVIDLTSYISTYLEVSSNGQLVATVLGTILIPASSGKVQCNYIFGTPGFWDVQFYTADSNNSRLYGEELQLRVVANLDDTKAAPAPCYASLDEANLYFSRRLGTSSWDGATQVDQQKALYQATALIDQLNFAGTVTSLGQDLQFPRSNTGYMYSGGLSAPMMVTDLSVPQAIINACAEIALQLLDDVDVNQEMRGVTTQKANVQGLHLQKTTDFVPEWLLAGIPSPVAWNMLKPFLADPLALSLTRLN